MDAYRDTTPLDKQRLIGGCLRLPLQIDGARLAAEVNALPADMWGTPGGRVGVHSAAEAIFLRGHAPAEGALPIEDRASLELVPYVREIMAMLQAAPLRCLLAKLPAGISIAPHVDRGPYFQRSLRMHFPVVTHERCYMLANGRVYVMRPAEAWGLNNGSLHGVWNADAQLARIHMICDFEPSAALLRLLATGERELQVDAPEAQQHFTRLMSGHLPPGTLLEG